MSPPKLHDFQLEAVRYIESERNAGHRRLCMVAPTGSGKTVIAAALIANATARGEHVLFIAHRRELVEQCSRKLHEAGVDHGIVLPGYPMRPGERVQVASIQSLHARAMTTSKIDLPLANLLIVDEAHHVRARTYMRLVDAYPNGVILGLTATPCRADGRGLGNVFETLVECPSVAALTAQKFLVPARIFAPVRPELHGIRIERGDYIESQLADRMDTAILVGDIVEHWFRLGERRKTVVFTVNVGHSVHIRDEFRRSGVLAEHIDGTTPVEDRKRILAGLTAGTVDVICNCCVLTEGWDKPEVSCLVLARPTKSLGLYLQMVGRVLRPAPHIGKTDALILDHSGAVFDHGFPDDEIIWTLATDSRAENPAHTARGTQHAPGLTICPECSAVRSEGRPCSNCGWHPVAKPAAVKVADGELGEVDHRRQVAKREYSDTERRRVHQELISIAETRGYKRGWAAHKYKEKFGDWPPFGAVDPLEPSPEVLAWVRSRQIAFAKSRLAQ
jgi:superfamily II DNA or RNA helicase